MSSNKKFKKWLRIAAAIMAAIFAYNLLEASAPFQHPEDGESDEYIAHEAVLYRQFANLYGEEALADLRSWDSLLGWTMSNSRRVSEEYVPWAMFRSRDAQMRWRKKNLETKFKQHVKIWKSFRNN